MGQVGLTLDSRVHIADEAQSFVTSKAYGSPPAKGSDSFVWSLGRIMRNSRSKTMPCFPVVWRFAINAILPEDENRDVECDRYRWINALGEEQDATWLSMLGVGAKDFANLKNGDLRALTVDNTLDATSIDLILDSVRSSGNPAAELLWRPIAIALGMDDLRGDLTPEIDSLLIVDFQSTCIEATPLDIQQGLRGENSALVPVRHAYRQMEGDIGVGGKRYSDLSWFGIVKELSLRVTKDDAAREQLLRGPFAGDFIEWAVGSELKYTWVFQGDQLIPIELDSLIRDNVYLKLLSSDEWQELVNDINTYKDEHSDSKVAMYGFPSAFSSFLERMPIDQLLPEKTISEGCVEYIGRVRDGKPTYLESVPSVEIVSRIEGQATADYIEIIEQGEYFGGYRVPVQPITRFSVDQGMEAFPIIIRRSDWGSTARKLDIEIPIAEEETPVIINAELKPGQGHIKLWIEGADGHEDVFGDQRQIYLNWADMEELELSVSIPPVSFLKGRIDEDSGLLAALQQMVDDVLNVEGFVMYNGANTKFAKLLKTRALPNAAGVQESRAMFGSEKIEEEQLKALSEKLWNTIDQTAVVKGGKNNRHNYFGYMYSNAPGFIVDELRQLFAQERPSIASWSTAFAPGRLFVTASDMELLLDFIQRVSDEEGCPSYPDESYTTKYFWSVFRCLCYYEDVINVPSGKMDLVLESIGCYLEKRNADNWTALAGETGRWQRTNTQNAEKFCLFAILYSCRRRDKDRGFLSPGSPLNTRLVSLIRDAPQLRFPRFFGVAVEADTLNNFTIRFLLNEAGDDDLALLSGLVTTMA